MTLRARRGSQVEAGPQEWAWSGRFVKDELNLLVGEPKIGKGTLMAYLLSRWTLGMIEGDLRRKRCNVSIVGTEDNFERVWVPRIEAVQGDTDKVIELSRDDYQQIDVRRDVEELGEAVKKFRIRVMYFDAFLDNLGISVNANNAKEVGDALAPLKSLANKAGVTCIATLHTNKKGASFRELQQMSNRFNGVSRSSLLLGWHPDKEDYRVLAVGASNYMGEVESREFKIITAHPKVGGRSVPTSRIATFDSSTVDVYDLVDAHANGRPRGTKTESVRDLIRDLLSDNEWHLAQEIYEICRAEGYTSGRLVRRAGDSLGVEKRHTDEYQGGNEWCLASNPTHARAAHE